MYGRRYVEVLGAPIGAALSLHDATGPRLMLRMANAAGGARVELPPGLPAGVYVLRAGNQAIRLLVE